MNKKITVKYGTQDRTMTLSQHGTIADVLNDSTNRIVLGYGDNVQGLIHGVAQPTDTVVPDGSTVVIENKANQKAN